MDQFFEIAELLKEFSEILHNVKEKVNQLNDENVEKSILEYKAGEGREFILKRILRQTFKDLIDFVMEKDDKQKLLLSTACSLCCFNLDWDYFIDQMRTIDDFYVRDLKTGEKVSISSSFDVKSWGQVRQRFDSNFFKFIRNGISHAKFDFDFENEKLIIKMRNDTFIVEIPMLSICTLPYSICNLATKSPAYDKTGLMTMVGEVRPPYEKGYCLRVKNEDLHAWDFISNESIPMELKSYLKKCKQENIRIEEQNDIHLDPMQKLKIVDESFYADLNHGKDVFREDYFDKLEQMLNFLDIGVVDFATVDFSSDIYQNSVFLKELMENKKMTLETRCGLISLKCGFDNKNYASNNLIVFGLLLNGLESVSAFINSIRNGSTPFLMDEVCEFSDRAYLNFICNYLESKFGISEDWKQVMASDYFAPNSFTTSNSVYDIFQSSQNKAFIRNCLVHPGFFKFDGENYIFTDYDKNGELVFEGEISRDDLIRFANDICEKFKLERLNQDQSQLAE